MKLTTLKCSYSNKVAKINEIYETDNSSTEKSDNFKIHNSPIFFLFSFVPLPSFAF